jgi:hypothetical protein
VHRLIALISAALILVSNSAHTAENEIWVCKYENETRKISVVYADLGTTLPCEVKYEKEGIERTIWNATTEEGFCEQKADALIVKQVGWGWQCEKMEPTGQ